MRQPIDNADFQARITFFHKLTEDMFSNGVFSREYVKLRADRVSLTLEAYFLLNDAYKARRIENGHNTEPPKIAGLMAMAIMKIRPMRSIPLTASAPVGKPWPNELAIQDCWPNEFAAIAWAGAAEKFEIDVSTDVRENLINRIAEVVHFTESRTLQGFWEDIYSSTKKDLHDYEFDLYDADLRQLNYLFSIFELLGNEAKLAAELNVLRGMTKAKIEKLPGAASTLE